MARASAGFAPAGMFSARTLPPSISSLSGGSRRRRPGTGRTASASSSGAAPYICMDSSGSGGGGQNTPATCGWSKSERNTLMPSTIDVRSLASSAVQSCRYHRSIASTCSRNSLPAPPPALLRLVCDLEFLEPVPECGVELASRLVRAGHRLPAPFPEGFLVSGEILGRDGGPHRAEPVGQLAGLADLPAEQFRIHRAAVDVLQRDPAPRQDRYKPI